MSMSHPSTEEIGTIARQFTKDLNEAATDGQPNEVRIVYAHTRVILSSRAIGDCGGAATYREMHHLDQSILANRCESVLWYAAPPV